MTNAIHQAIREVCEFTEYESGDLIGWTLRRAFQMAEDAGATVYWGMWSKADLETLLTVAQLPCDYCCERPAQGYLAAYQAHVCRECYAATVHWNAN